MPYIEKTLRSLLDSGACSPANPGDLNYVITRTIMQYWDGDRSYQKINDIVGALECSKQEFYHRIAQPYEYEKRITNGDVY